MAFKGSKKYWQGNIEKIRILDEVLSSGDGPVKVLDFGAGRGGDWVNVLQDNPNLFLYAYEPAISSRRELIEKFTGVENVQCISEDELKILKDIDYIVSFSVFEHVVDKRNYLKLAYDALKQNGIFYLNYDDGHFRGVLDFYRFDELKKVIREFIYHWRFRKGIGSKNPDEYRHRVTLEEAGNLIKDAGFTIGSVRFGNLSNFKDLTKTVPEGSKEEFADFWLSVEDELNTRFKTTMQTPLYGGKCNLWSVMGSVTMALQK